MEKISLQPENIAAILPIYAATGDICTIVRNDGTEIPTDLRVRTILAKLAKALATDLQALKEQVFNTVHCALLHPLPLNHQLLLLPVKIRTPLIQGDPSIGYLNYYAINKIRGNTLARKHTLVELKSGYQLSVLWSVRTMQRHLQQAQLAASLGNRHNRQVSNLNESRNYCRQLNFILRINSLFRLKKDIPVLHSDQRSHCSIKFS